MYKTLVSFFILTLCFGNSIAGELEIKVDELKQICASFESGGIVADEGGFPFVVDKTSIDIDSRECGIRANIRLYDFKIESMAKDKLFELIEAKSIIGIDLKSVDENEYEWKPDDRKYAFITINGNLIFDVVFNSNPEYLDQLIQLTKSKYSDL